MLAIGTSCGSILLYEIPFRGTNIRLINELLEKDLKYGVGDLAANPSGTNLACSDTNGNIFVWDIDVYPSIKLAYKLNETSPCTCLNIWKGYLIGGFGNGKINLYDIVSGEFGELQLLLAQQSQLSSLSHHIQQVSRSSTSLPTRDGSTRSMCARTGWCRAEKTASSESGR